MVNFPWGGTPKPALGLQHPESPGITNEDTGHGLDGAFLLGAVVDGPQPGQHALQDDVHGLHGSDLAEHAHAASGHVAHGRVGVLQAGAQVKEVLQELQGPDKTLSSGAKTFIYRTTCTNI